MTSADPNTPQPTVSDRGQTTGIEAVADDTTDPMGVNPTPNQGGAAFPGDGSGATSGYGEETVPGSTLPAQTVSTNEQPDDSTETSDRDDEVINGEPLSPDEEIPDDLDDDVA